MKRTPSNPLPGAEPVPSSSMAITVGTPIAIVGRYSAIQSKNRLCEKWRAKTMVPPVTSIGITVSMWVEGQLKDRYSRTRSAGPSFHMSIVCSAIQK